MKYFFDFSTVYTAIITCNLLIIIIAIIIRNEKVMLNTGYKLITGFLVLTTIRFLLPIQVPFVTTIPLPQGISSIFVPLFTPLFLIQKLKVTPIRIIGLIWVTGVLIQSYKYYKANKQIYCHIMAFGNDVSKKSRYSNIIENISCKKISSIHIYELPELETPLIYGFFKPCILFPANFSCTDTELTYILKHEISHYLHHDLEIKFFTKLLTIIYWWNPFGYLLYQQVNLVLEMRIDDAITTTSDKDALEYLQCLLHLAEYQNAIFQNSMSNTISFSHNDDNVLTKRFQMLIRRKRKKNKYMNLLLICLIGFIYLSSYLFIFEGNVKNSDISDDILNLSEINSFIIDNGDGTYDFYFSNFKVETLNSLEHFNDDIPIITKEEYERVQQEAPE